MSDRLSLNSDREDDAEDRAMEAEFAAFFIPERSWVKVTRDE